MAEPTAEGNSLLDPKGSHKLLEAVPLRAIAYHGKAGQIISQEGSSRAQSEVTCLSRDQDTDENQLKLGAGLRTARVVGTQGTAHAVLRHKEKFVAVCRKLGVGLGRVGYDACGVAKGGASERQISIQIPQVGDPFPLLF